MIKDVRWNYEAGSKRIVFVHITTETGSRLTIEIEESLSKMNWILRHRTDFMVRLKSLV